MKFTIRDLFLVTVIVALVVGRWVDRSRLVSELQKEQLDRIFGNFERDARRGPRTTMIPIEDRDEVFQKVVNLTNKSMPNSSAPAPNPPKP